METLTKNTLVVFMYRDGSNYKTWSEVVLKGTLSKEEISELISTFGNPSNLFVPNQCYQGFVNSCPRQRGTDYPTNNGSEWDDEFDHSHHTIFKIEDTDRPAHPHIKINASEFYKLALETDYHLYLD